MVIRQVRFVLKTAAAELRQFGYTDGDAEGIAGADEDGHGARGKKAAASEQQAHAAASAALREHEGSARSPIPSPPPSLASAPKATLPVRDSPTRVTERGK